MKIFNNFCPTCNKDISSKFKKSKLNKLKDLSNFCSNTCVNNYNFFTVPCYNKELYDTINVTKEEIDGSIINAFTMYKINQIKPIPHELTTFEMSAAIQNNWNWNFNKKECQQCKTGFKVKIKEANDDIKYCSNKCLYIAEPKLNPDYINKVNRIICNKNCPTCGKEIDLLGKQISKVSHPFKAHARFCSLQCTNNYNFFTVPCYNKEYYDTINVTKEELESLDASVINAFTLYKISQIVTIDSKYTKQNIVDSIKNNWQFDVTDKACVICNTLFNIDNKSKDKQTCSSSCSGKLKYKITCEKLNITNISQLSGHKDKVNTTCQEKYGTDWASQSDEKKEKSKQTCLQKYGVDNYGKTQECADYNSEFVKQYLKDNPDVLLKRAQAKKQCSYNNIKEKYSKFNYDFISTEAEYQKDGFAGTYKVECTQCNTIFDHCTRKLPLCTICNAKNMNGLENKIMNILRENNVYSVPFDRKQIAPFELDFYLPHYNLAIEVCGLYYHSLKQYNYHQNKLNMCKAKNIELLTIFEDEIIHKFDIVKNRIEYKLKLNNTKIISARKCEIKYITNKERDDFCNKYHIQGACNSPIRYGAYFNNELVAVMTFASTKSRAHAINNIDTTAHELVRFVTNNTRINGIANRMLNKFKLDHTPHKIISYTDLRWNNGKIYQQLGFIKKITSKPNYWWCKSTKRYSRVGFQKQCLSKKLKIFDADLSESQNMENNGYHKIYDCGTDRYEMICK